ncbi:MAG: biopolymer transporter ExbD [Alkalinema sp. CAN_BIN05]|nr:biopolymer transporter ExbD [Alkalinema sp. CAN_BIN05]
MRLPEEPDQPFQINIVPMIDVVFALLTFFIMSTLSLTRSEGLPVNLPGAQTSKAINQETPVVVTIDGKGNLTLNKKTIDLGQLRSGIQEQLADSSQKMVLIRADQAVTHGKVVAVMDAVRRIPGAKLAIETQAIKN